MSRASWYWDISWNPVSGCSHASPGCTNCYAQQLAGTQQTSHRIELYLGTTEWRRGRPVWNGKLKVAGPEHDTWKWPLKWPGARHPLLGPGMPSLIFVGDMADLFHEERPIAHIDLTVGTVAASCHIGQLLTKRADRIEAYFARKHWSPRTLRRYQMRLMLGFSAERQVEFDQRWPHMRELVGAGWFVFVSVAPLLGPVTLPPDFLALGDGAWVIVAGEQKPGTRNMNPDWARALRDQCAKSGVNFFMKQMSGNRSIPRDLLIRQFPVAAVKRRIQCQ